MHWCKLVCCGLTLWTAGGCATVMRGKEQGVRFQTEPPGATVQIDGKTYTAPATIPLKRGDKHQVVISHPGYRTVQFELAAQWDGASLPGMIVPGGSVMMATDAANGADKAFNDLEIIHLPPDQPPSTQPLLLYERRGKLMTQAEYDADLAAERADRTRFMGSETP